MPETLHNCANLVGNTRHAILSCLILAFTQATFPQGNQVLVGSTLASTRVYVCISASK